MRTNKEMFDELDSYIESTDNKPSELLSILIKAQDIFGYLPMSVQTHIADKLKISVSKVYGVVTFNKFFTMVPKGSNVINVCLGTACFVKGSMKILEKIEEVLQIKNGETTSDGKFTLSTLRCIGSCGLAPVMQINDKVYGNLKVEDIEDILKSY